MRTLVIIAIGLVLGPLSLRLTPAARRTLIAWLFAGVWLPVCALNLRTGLSHGYSLQEELPIHLVLYGVPVLATLAYAFWLRRRG